MNRSESSRTPWADALRTTPVRPVVDDDCTGRLGRIDTSDDEALAALTKSALHLIRTLRSAPLERPALAEAARRYAAAATRASIPPSHVRLALELLVNEHAPVPVLHTTIVRRGRTDLAHERARRRALRPLVDELVQLAGVAVRDGAA